MNRRILFVALQAGTGGMETRFAALLPRLNAGGWQTRMLILGSPGPFSETLRAHGVEVQFVTRASSPFLRAPARLLGIIRQCRAFQPQIVHGCDSVAGVYARVAAMIARVPVRFSSLNTNYFITPSLQRLEKVLSKYSNGVICNSEQGRRLLVEKSGLAPSKVFVLRQGIELHQPHLNGSGFKLRIHLGIDASTVLVGMVGKLTVDKDPLCFVDAAALVHQRHPSVHFCIVASGPLERDVRARIALHRMNDVITMVAERSDASSLMQEFDVAVMTSINEGLPNTLLEYMRAGRPVVVTNVGECSNVAVNGETGFVVQPRDPSAVAAALTRLIEDTALRAQLGRQGRSRLELEFNIDRYVGEITTVFSNALVERGAA